jgi:acyl dehydratase
MASVVEMAALVGKTMGVSSWIMIDQARIDQFAAVTNDHQFIHVDPVAARATPFGGTIAHGLLTLSLLPSMIYEVVPALDGMKLAANYGYNKVRFIAPVRSFRRIRGHFKLLDFTETKPSRWQQIIEATVEIENEDKPALIAEGIGQIFL